MANIYTDNLMFNAEYYVANNPDLAAIVPALTAEQAEEHYIKWGAEESATGDVRVGPNSWFDIQFYREMNPDLEELADADLLFHFSTYGAAEGRSPNAEFSATQFIDAELFLDYALANEDLMEAYGIKAGATRLTDEQQANVAYQYFAYGINEEREGGIASVVEVPVSLEEALAKYEVAKDAADEANKAFATATEAQAEAQSEVDAAAVETATALADLKAGVPNKYLPDNFDDLPLATQETLVANAQSVLNANLVVAETKAAGAAAVVAGAEIVTAAEDAVTAAEDAVTAAEEGFGASDTEGAVADFIKANADAEPAVTVTDVEFDGKELSIAVDGEDESVLLAAINQITGEIVLLEKGYEGTAALLAAAQAQYNAEQAVATAEAALLDAQVEALGTAGMLFIEQDGKSVPLTAKQAKEAKFSDENKLVFGEKEVGAGKLDETTGKVTAPETITALTEETVDSEANALAEVVVVSELNAAQEAVADFDALVDAWNDAKAAETEANATLETANADLQTATEAKDAADAAQAAAKAAVEAAAGDDVNLVEVNEDGDYVGTEGVDLFVFGGEDMTITNFGKGEDKIFVNGDYKLTVVDSAADIKDNADASVLEIFAYEENGNTVLAVEDNELSGSVTGSTEFTYITLTGTTGTVSEDGDFIVVA